MPLCSAWLLVDAEIVSEICRSLVLLVIIAISDIWRKSSTWRSRTGISYVRHLLEDIITRCPFPLGVAQASHALQRLHVLGGATRGDETEGKTRGRSATPSTPVRSWNSRRPQRCGNEARWHDLGAIYLHRTEALTSGSDHEAALQRVQMMFADGCSACDEKPRLQPTKVLRARSMVSECYQIG